MHTRIKIIALLTTLFAGLLTAGTARCATTHESTIRFGLFGDVHIYQNSDKPGDVVLFISGDGGWNLGVIDMARALANMNALVAGIDINHYLAALGKAGTACSYPAAHFEELSQFLQQRYHFDQYRPPVLVGYSSGASLVYTLVAQAPDNTFASGISLGFCPELTLHKPLCKANGALQWSVSHKGASQTFAFTPARQLHAPWTVLQGEIDRVCPPQQTEAFVARVKGAQIVRLPKVGHGYSVQTNWLPQFKKTFMRMHTSQNTTVVNPAHGAPNRTPPELPLVELPVTKPGNTLAVILSGDGGWAGIDKALGEALNADGIPVVGFNSLQYFWNRKTPEQTATDLGKTIAYYSRAWQRNDVVLIGYSRGAEVLPFAVNRLPQALRPLIGEIMLLGPSPAVDFQFHVSDWLSNSPDDKALAVLPEINRLAGYNLLCLYGADEQTNSVCPKLDPKRFRSIVMPGGHHFGGNYEQLAKIVLQHRKKTGGKPAAPVQ